MLPFLDKRSQIGFFIYLSRSVKIFGFFKSFVPGILSSGWKCKAAIICSGLANRINICICINIRDAFCFVF